MHLSAAHDHTPYRSSGRHRRRNRFLAGLTLLAALLGFASWTAQQPAHHEETASGGNTKLRLPIEPLPHLTPAKLETPPTLRPTVERVSYEIQSGDTLSSIFSELELDREALDGILSADESLLALDTLRPGHRLSFALDREDGSLRKLELFVHAGNRVIYEQVEPGLFAYREIRREGSWSSRLHAGEVNGSFYISAREAGLDDQDIFTISRILSEQINFSRDFHAGDTFRIIKSHNFVGGEPTGRSRIEAISIEPRQQSHSAFLFEDGRYYDENGESLERAFSRLPVAGRYRISSPFAPDRRHPITGRVSPHNGTDFATPTGTPVRSTGDGVVTRVEKHPYAGLYIEIEHGERYSTRYLHLSKALVSRGDKVERDEKIALSGNSGRSTGPHLHFELHANGRPVNAMKEDIPQADSVPETKMAQFNRRVARLTAGMEHEQSLQLAASEVIRPPAAMR